ncbi:Deoxyuridine 5'-triphosphate nucleotidohydrolase [Candidatus Rubidus massiliensis]|nr:Deoxyuridine 5'-triphosphate nucleotidohydrolase [Candidatus Rubidus massiliensis]
MKSLEPIVVLTETAQEDLLPYYASHSAAGADVRACLEQDVVIEPGSSALIPTGLKFEIPEGYEIQVRPRSGLALKNQITVLNTPGTIDADYRGEVGVILINHGKSSFVVKPGMRIAQLIIAQVVQARFIIAKELAQTNRGSGGFGHTGV